MQLSFRAKLVLLVGVAAASFVAIIFFDGLTSASEAQRLAQIEARYLPLLELGPEVNAAFERLRRGFQDAAAASDLEVLAETERLRNELLNRLERARAVLPKEQLPVLTLRLDGYYDAAQDLTRRVIAGETGEAILGAMQVMQSRQKLLGESLVRATRFDRGQLSHAFSSMREERVAASRVRGLVAAICLGLVLTLSLQMGRGMNRALNELTEGFARFGRNELGSPITVVSADEIAAVANQANVMATHLRELLEQQEKERWLSAGRAELSDQLRGDLATEELAQRALVVLTRQLESPIAILYAVDDKGELTPLAGYGLDDEALRAAPVAGLVAQARQGTEVVRLCELPNDYLRVRSGLGESPPSAIWIAPIRRFGRLVAVVELAFLAEPIQDAERFLQAACESIAVAMESAAFRRRQQILLDESRSLAARLSTQEEELRAANEALTSQSEELRVANDELSAQQEELRAVNEELVQQTEEREAQRLEILERNRELEATRENLELQAGELEAMSRYKSQFLANMSHELRTPLNSMLLLSELLAANEDGKLSPKQVEFAATIRAAGSDLLRLINDVLDLAKIEAGRLEVHPSDVRLREVVAHLRRVYEPLASAKKLNFRVEVTPEVPDTVIMDRGKLEQVLTNLLGNAIKFTDRGEVSLTVSLAPVSMAAEQRPGVMFQVRDTGIGIASSDLTRIFEPFEQADGGSRRRFGGTGLGLAIARPLATLLGGTLTAQSTPNKGSTFELRLPLSKVVQDVGPVDQEDPRSSRPSVAPATNRTIVGTVANDTVPLLVVEDDLLFAERVMALANEAGLPTVLAKDGWTALRLAQVHRPCGIVLDLNLPDMAGATVMEVLQTAERTRDIPVHVISCSDQERQVLALGAVGYLRKPVSRVEILRALERLVPSASQRRVLVVEDDPTYSGSLATALQEQGIASVCVGSGAEALAELAKGQYAAMVLDLGLPDMDGLEILDKICGNAEPPRLPVIVHTGRALSRSETARLEAYADRVVPKDAGSVGRVLEEVSLFIHQLRVPLRKQELPSPLDERVLEGRKVLIADDDMRTAYAVSALLRGRGMIVLLADTGKAAVETLKQEPDVDVILMDIMMPEMDGYDAMRVIRSEPKFSTLPIIALTAKAMQDDRVRCVAAGASDYLSKPVDSERLVSLLRGWLAAS